MKDLAFNFPTVGHTVLVHAPFGKGVQDTRFVTKRISSLLSEAMVVNNPFSGDQMQILKIRENGLELNTDFLMGQFQKIPVLVLNPIAVGVDGPELVDVFAFMDVLRESLPIQECFTFTKNSRSPLSQQKPLIESAEDVAKWVAIYEEEKPALSQALRLAPSRLVSPLNLNK